MTEDPRPDTAMTIKNASCANYSWGGLKTRHLTTRCGLLYVGLVSYGSTSADSGGTAVEFELLQTALVAVVVLLMWLLLRKGRRRPFAYLYRLKGRRLRKFGIKTEVCRIGRHPNNDLRLTDRSVSRFHADLVRNANGTFSIYDAGSKNGITVGLRPVRSSVLRDGDVIGLGDVRFKFSRFPRDYNVHRKTDMLEITSSRFHSRRRRERRTELTTPMRLYNEDTGWINGRMRNIGRDGAFLETEMQLTPRLPVDIVVAVVEGKRRRWLHLTGEVVWSDAKGAGVSFTDRDPAVLDRLLKRAA